jgi:hypothetical protein
MKEYVVVYESGCVGEYAVEKFSTFTDAFNFMNTEFCKDEIEEFHINIALDVDGERTYEF